MNKFLHGLAIGCGIITAFGLAILAGAIVLYILTSTNHLDPIFKYLGIY